MNRGENRPLKVLNSHTKILDDIFSQKMQNMKGNTTPYKLHQTHLPYCMTELKS